MPRSRPDAVPVAKADGARRIEARETQIWIRIGGAWKFAHVHCWFHQGQQWACWVSYQVDPGCPTLPPQWGLFAYDPRTILNRAEVPVPPR